MVLAIFASYSLPSYKSLPKIQNGFFSTQHRDGSMIREENGILCQTKQAMHKGDGAATPLLPLSFILPVKQQLLGTITRTITK